MPKIVRKRLNLGHFHLFWIYFLPKMGQRPIFPPPPPGTEPLYYIHPWVNLTFSSKINTSIVVPGALAHCSLPVTPHRLQHLTPADGFWKEVKP